MNRLALLDLGSSLIILRRIVEFGIAVLYLMGSSKI
jgi:hypothetical protein